MGTGCRLLVPGFWSLVTGCWFLVSDFRIPHSDFPIQISVLCLLPSVAQPDNPLEFILILPMIFPMLNTNRSVMDAFIKK
jgi:enhancing lycopene biosynthesis protein 2